MHTYLVQILQVLQVPLNEVSVFLAQHSEGTESRRQYGPLLNNKA
jgi:hypothetical protein